MKKLIVSFLLTVSILMGLPQAPARAAKISNGTPTAIRGTWKKPDKVNMGGKIKKSTLYFTVGKSSVTVQRLGYATYTLSKIKYHKASTNVYLLQGKSSVTGKQDKMRIYKKGNKMEWKNSWSAKYSYLGWLSKKAKAKKSVYKKGFPKVLQGKWKSKAYKYFGRFIWTVKGRTSTVSAADPYVISSANFRQTSKNHYTIEGIESFYSHKVASFKVTVKSAKHVVMNVQGDNTDWYK